MFYTIAYAELTACLLSGYRIGIFVSWFSHLIVKRLNFRDSSVRGCSVSNYIILCPVLVQHGMWKSVPYLKLVVVDCTEDTVLLMLKL